ARTHTRTHAHTHKHTHTHTHTHTPTLHHTATHTPCHAATHPNTHPPHHTHTLFSSASWCFASSSLPQNVTSYLCSVSDTDTPHTDTLGLLFLFLFSPPFHSLS